MLLRLARGGPIDLPVLRLPCAVFPRQPISLPVLKLHPYDRPLPGCLSPAAADELCVDARVADELERGRRRDLPPLSGHVALLAAGATVGVVVELPHKAAAAHAASAVAQNGSVLHAVGGPRVSLVHTLHKSPAGARFARFSPLDDADAPPLPAQATGATLEDVADAARTLLRATPRAPGSPHSWLAAAIDESTAADAGGAPSLPLALQTTDVERSVRPPIAFLEHMPHHPRWRELAEPPDDPSQLSFWLAARLPLTTALRLRLLGYDCALERLKHTVGAMRLLSSHAAHEAAGAGARAAVGSEGAGGGWLRVVWEEAPAQEQQQHGGEHTEARRRPVVDWIDWAAESEH